VAPATFLLSVMYMYMIYDHMSVMDMSCIVACWWQLRFVHTINRLSNELHCLPTDFNNNMNNWWYSFSSIYNAAVDLHNKLLSLRPGPYVDT